MTIEEIKEIRATVLPIEQEYFDAHSVEMVDSLLAEVDLEKSNHENTKHWLSETRKHLTIATEALNDLLDWAENQCGLSGNDECYGRYQDEELIIARTALERIKE